MRVRARDTSVCILRRMAASIRCACAPPTCRVKYLGFGAQMQEELQVKNFQKVDESKRKVTAVSKAPPESGKLAEFKERRRQSMSYKEEQGVRAPVDGLGSAT